MTPFRRNKWKKLYISSLAVIYLVFFTAQLSYKFHICANFPLFGVSDDGVDNKLEAAFDSKGPNVDHKFYLSVDKRYDFKHVFGLVTPSFTIEHWYFVDWNPILTYSAGHQPALPGYKALRGPPAA
jgi:hypothetical protein